MLECLPPVCDAATRLLVLGSFPGVRSLQLQQYYGHPHNQFWRIVGSVLDVPDLASWPYAQRCACLLAHGVGVWDVYAACERVGSLDSAIRHAVVNDFAALRLRCPLLQAVAHHGGESWRHRRHTQALGVPVYRLPSTSPANASWSFARKLEAWRAVFAVLNDCAAPPVPDVDGWVVP